jgi:leucyl/phenylalanyl-tRNA--protein transferase
VNLLDRSRPAFPPVHRALTDPNGLLAIGGELSAEWLISAYRQGIFPWFDSDDDPVLWWSPDPRTVVFPQQMKVSRSLRKRIRNAGFQVTFDTAFDAVIRACAEPREGADGRTSGTWITPAMIAAYCHLHELGLAHSVETWQTTHTGDLRLVGGLYGVSLGRMFFGESMFAKERDASKVAFYHLCQLAIHWDFELIDCQVGNPHLDSLGATEVPRDAFIRMIEKNAHQPTHRGPWSDVTPDDWCTNDSRSTSAGAASDRPQSAAPRA